MSKLSLGGSKDLPPGWGFPSPLYNHDTGKYDSSGMVWYGYPGHEKCKMKDIKALRAWKAEVDIDLPTVFGGRSFFERNNKLEPWHRTVYLGR